MYRLLLYGLALVAGVGIAFGFTGDLSTPGTSMVWSLALLLAVCYATNRVLALFWGVATNYESSLITALILFLVMPPAQTTSQALALVIVGILAIASKYIFALQANHIFNPAAVALVIIGLLDVSYATWWVGSGIMLPFTLIFGVLVLRKLRRFLLFFSFATVGMAVMLWVGWQHSLTAADILPQALTSWPLVFFGTVMLTEPSTMPPRRWQQIAYGSLVGAIFASQITVGILSTTPQMALIIGNFVAYLLWGLKYKVRLRLDSKQQLSAHIFDYGFVPDRKLNFAPGQYMEWTLGHAHPDSRGNRRTFTIASSPTENCIHLGVKFYEPSSSFKKALQAMAINERLVAGHVAGDFVLPKDSRRKLAFVAGGIGITPFRSMLKYLIDTKQQRDIILFYMIANPDEISYQEVLDEAENIGLTVVPVLGQEHPPADWKHPTGFLTAELVAKFVPDFAERLFYLSGPNAMVVNYKHLLQQIGVKRWHIKTDYFSGY